MKTRNIRNTAISLVLIGITITGHAQLANMYPGDVGIENDPDVLFVDKFEDGLTNIFSRYSQKQNSAGMSLDSDVPPGSPGQYSLKMTNGQGNTGGQLYKKFTPGWNGTVYMRFYIKYASVLQGYLHHAGGSIGGFNPPSNYYLGLAGKCGDGDKRFKISFENSQQTNLDTYMYWGDMKSWDGGTSCYGNEMISENRTGYGQPPSSNAPVIDFDQWMCIEIMVKLNDPVTAYNGELAVWKNGVKLGHWGPGFPNGHWTKDKWYNNPNDQTVFEGFRWRTVAGLNINWIMLEDYISNPDAPPGYVKFDHVVVARKYIGPIYTGNCTPPNPTVTASGPTDICQGDSVTLDAGGGYSSYVWSSGATTQTITVTKAASYFVSVTNSQGCSRTSTPVKVTVTAPPAPVVNANGPAAWCDNKTFLLDAGTGYAGYSWSNGATTQAIFISRSGSYSVTVTDAGICGARTSQVKTIAVNSGCTTTVLGETSDTDAPGSSQDTYLNTNDNNYSQAAQLNTYTWPANTSANAILMKWDLSSLPAGQAGLPPIIQIDRADLLLYQTKAGGDSLYEVSVHKVVSKNPDITTATGNTYDGTNAWTSPLAQGDIGPAVDVPSLNTLNGYKDWDVTAMVQDWYANPFADYGLLLNSDETASADSYRYFASSEHSDAGMRPKLVISYTDMTTGISGTIETGGIRVYPNPTTGELRITNDELRMKNAGFGLSTLDFRLFDIYGRVVLEHQQLTTNNQQLDLSHLPAGVYFLTITTATGIVTEKIVKH